MNILNKGNRNILVYILGTFIILLLGIYGITIFGRYGFSFLGGNNPARTYENPPQFNLKDEVDYYALISTNYGDIEYDLLEDKAPLAVNSFVFLAEDGYYNNTEFYRLEKDLFLQAGSRMTLDLDPANDSIDSPGYTFSDEINWGDINLTNEQKEKLNEEGYESNRTVRSVEPKQYNMLMANAGPNVNGSQFLILLMDSNSNDIEDFKGRHTVFARLTNGKNTLEKINGFDVDFERTTWPRPSERIIIQSVSIIER